MAYVSTKFYMLRSSMKSPRPGWLPSHAKCKGCHAANAHANNKHSRVLFCAPHASTPAERRG